MMSLIIVKASQITHEYFLKASYTRYNRIESLQGYVTTAMDNERGY